MANWFYDATAQSTITASTLADAVSAVATGHTIEVSVGDSYTVGAPGGTYTFTEDQSFSGEKTLTIFADRFEGSGATDGILFSGSSLNLTFIFRNSYKVTGGKSITIATGATITVQKSNNNTTANWYPMTNDGAVITVKEGSKFTIVQQFKIQTYGTFLITTADSVTDDAQKSSFTAGLICMGTPF